MTISMSKLIIYGVAIRMFKMRDSNLELNIKAAA